MDTAAILWTILMCTYSFGECVYTPAMETQIRQETILSASYDAVSRPDPQTHVKIGLSILAIDELDIKAQRFTIAGWLTFEWSDSRITWNKTEKNDTEYIFSKPKAIWKPEVVIDNSLADVGVVHDDELQLRIKYDGTVEWEPLLLFSTHCSVDITFYPYDQQKCAIQVTSWGYRIEELLLEHTLDEVNLEDYEENGEWTISKSAIEERNLTEQTAHGIGIHRQLIFWFYLDRRTDYYNLNVMMPVFLNSLLIILVFLVPVESGEKLTYVLTVELSLAVLLTVVNNSLPSTSITTSILGIYLGSVLLFAGLGIFLSVIIIMIYHKPGEPDMTSVLVTVGHYASTISCRSLGKKFTTLKRVSPTDADLDDVKETVTWVVTWQDISEAINRMCLYIVMAVTVIMNITFFMLLSLGSQKW